jgi:hypothetical protein
VRSWTFEALLERLPDEDHLVLELGEASSFVFPREAGRVIVVPPGHKTARESSKIAYVEGDISHVPTVLNAAAFGVDLFGERATLLMSAGGLDGLAPGDAHELCELLLSDPGPCVAAILQTRHEPSWRFTGDPTASGLVARIQDYQPKTQDRRDPWWLYMRPHAEDREENVQ